MWKWVGVTIVATATLGAIFGYGGLGRYLIDGIAQNDDGQLCVRQAWLMHMCSTGTTDNRTRISTTTTKGESK